MIIRIGMTATMVVTGNQKKNFIPNEPENLMQMEKQISLFQ